MIVMIEIILILLLANFCTKLLEQGGKDNFLNLFMNKLFRKLKKFMEVSYMI